MTVQRTRRIIFLDIDGVVRSTRHDTAMAGKWHYNPDAVAWLNALTRSTGARLVLSSTWRSFGIQAMRHRLASWGIVAPLDSLTPVYSHTPDYTPCPRGIEIASWLGTRGRRGTAPDRFVILDDDMDMAHLLPYLVPIHRETGLTEHTTAIAFQRLIRQNGP